MDETPGLGTSLREAIEFLASIFDFEKLESAKKNKSVLAKVKEIGEMPVTNIFEIRSWKIAWTALIVKVNVDPSNVDKSVQNRT